jgi:hypothetical protein
MILAVCLHGSRNLPRQIDPAGEFEAVEEHSGHLGVIALACVGEAGWASPLLEMTLLGRVRRAFAVNSQAVPGRLSRLPDHPPGGLVHEAPAG